MSNVPTSKDGPVAQVRAMPPMTWHGVFSDAANTATDYLHLFVFRCAKCNGPVIVGSLATRPDDISREINVRRIGALCLACGVKPERVEEPGIEHRFRPVPWAWALMDSTQTADLLAGQNSGPSAQVASNL